MDHQKLLDAILYARTPEEISAANVVAERWLSENPDDMAVQQALEQLAMVEEAMKQENLR